ncbi:hypothetical protein GW17_00033377 [Ensete ventricosum]|nr:hypothetical protein GW17_00033377 [Ensete ventricosum]
MVEISTITARYRSVMFDFDRRRPLSGSFSLATAGYDEGRRSRRKRENLGRCHPLTTSQRLGCQRCLRPENLGTTSQMRRTSRGGSFFVVVFSCEEKPRRLLIRSRRRK